MPWMRLVGTLLLAMALVAFKQARPGYQFDFPRDYFSHPEFQAEWWYYTGNLSDREGRPFGFELTFFRVSLPLEDTDPGDWSLDQVYVAHFVLTDIKTGRVYTRERTNRAGPGVAGASETNRTIWNGNWSVEYLSGGPLTPSQTLWAGHAEASISLSLVPSKRVVIHGKDGVSRKSAGEGHASHYLSFTRLNASGTIAVGEETFEVEGLAWMDHEFFTNTLTRDQSGWDWMSIQLNDGTELMLYGIRDLEGRHGPYSSGTFVDATGRTQHLSSEDFGLKPGRTWRSPTTAAAYPVEWLVEVPGLDLRLEVRPQLDVQEVVSDLGYTPAYWEGAVTYTGFRAGEPLQGKGYLEMTGYDKPFRLGFGSRTNQR